MAGDWCDLLILRRVLCCVSKQNPKPFWKKSKLFFAKTYWLSNPISSCLFKGAIHVILRYCYHRWWHCWSDGRAFACKKSDAFDCDFGCAIECFNQSRQRFFACFRNDF